VKPKLDSSNSQELESVVFTGELIGNLSPSLINPLQSQQKQPGSDFNGALRMIGFPEDLLWEGVNQLQDIQEQRHKKPSINVEQPPPVEHNDDFISLGADEDSASEAENQVATNETDLLRQQVKSLQSTQKESFKIMRELRKEREVLLKELSLHRGGT